MSSNYQKYYYPSIGHPLHEVAISMPAANPPPPSGHVEASDPSELHASPRDAQDGRVTSTWTHPNVTAMTWLQYRNSKMQQYTKN